MNKKSCPHEPPIVIFDGVCNLCNGWVDFLLKHDRTQSLRFASFQSVKGGELLRDHDVTTAPDTVYVLANNSVLTQSSAIIYLLGYCDSVFLRALAKGLGIIPKTIRDSLYRSVAHRRYRWFGKRDTCRVPTPEEWERFIE